MSKAAKKDLAQAEEVLTAHDTFSCNKHRKMRSRTDQGAHHCTPVKGCTEQTCEKTDQIRWSRSRKCSPSSHRDCKNGPGSKQSQRCIVPRASSPFATERVDRERLAVGGAIVGGAQARWTGVNRDLRVGIGAGHEEPRVRLIDDLAEHARGRRRADAAARVADAQSELVDIARRAGRVQALIRAEGALGTRQTRQRLLVRLIQALSAGQAVDQAALIRVEA